MQCHALPLTRHPTVIKMTSQTFNDFMADASDNHFQSEANSILFFKQDLLHLKVTS